jgi:universal stress protein A
MDVLCGVDFSKHSASALRYAATVAQRVKGSLTVAFVNDPLLDVAAAAAYDKRAVSDASRRQLERFVERALGKARAGRVACAIVAGDPATTIHTLAQDRGCGLIVVGTQGLRGSKHMFFGSTTARLLRVAAIPVLAVPPKAPSKPPANWPGRLVACAVDLDEHVVDDARTAAALARSMGAKLVLVHAVKPPAAPPWLVRRKVKDSDLIRPAEADLAARAAQLDVEPRPETRVLVGDPASAISAFAKRQVRLVILRLRRGRGLLGSRPGTITYEMLSISTVPVLALPAEHPPA